MKLITFIIFFLINSLGFAQQNQYSLWRSKMNNSIYLKEFMKLNVEAESRIRNNYYGNNLKKVEKVDKNCFKSETQLTQCLKNVGFQKSDEYAKSIFSRVTLFGKFVKENPNFYKLDLELRSKLLTNYFKDNFFQNFII